MRKILFIFLLLLLNITAMAQNGSLVVISNVADVDVYLNDNRIGSISNDKILRADNIKIGSFRLSARKNGYIEYRTNIEIRQAVTTTTRVTLMPAKAKIIVDCNIGGANVYFDGAYKGKTSYEGNYVIPNLSIGRYELRVEKEGYDTVKRDISISNNHLGVDVTEKVNLKEKGTSGNIILVITIILICLGMLALIFTIFKVIGSFKLMRGRFDSYVIRELLGRGGMSTVYRATDLKDKKEIALKILDDRLLRDRDLVNKFNREGSGLSLLNKKFPDAPIVKIYRYGRENSAPYGRPFIAMELIKGPSLLDLINRKKNFSLSYIINLIKQVAHALSTAHALGIYHRDVSPDNIIIVRNNPNFPLIKLIDFGVAKHEYVDVGTLDGTISGKPPYMSPEQCRGEKVDGRSDIYSLGIIFYTMLTGDPPFASKNPLEVMYLHEHKPMPPLPIHVPERIRRIVSKMLEKQKAKRYQTIKGLIEDLNKLEI